METEIIDLIDTALKIGLGALIAGLSTFVIAERKYASERNAMREEDTKNELKYISEKFQESDAGTNEFFGYVNTAIDHGEDDYKKLAENCRKSMDKAFYALGLAISSANLLGKEELFVKLSEYENLITKLDSKVDSFQRGVPDDASEFEEISFKCEPVEKEIYKLLRQAYVKYKA